MSAESSSLRVSTASASVNPQDSIPRKIISDIDARIRKISVRFIIVAAAAIVVAKLMLPVGIAYGAYCACTLVIGGSLFAIYRSKSNHKFEEKKDLPENKINTQVTVNVKTIAESISSSDDENEDINNAQAIESDPLNKSTENIEKTQSSTSAEKSTQIDKQLFLNDIKENHNEMWIELLSIKNCIKDGKISFSDKSSKNTENATSIVIVQLDEEGRKDNDPWITPLMFESLAELNEKSDTENVQNKNPLSVQKNIDGTNTLIRERALKGNLRKKDVQDLLEKGICTQSTWRVEINVRLTVEDILKYVN